MALLTDPALHSHSLSAAARLSCMPSAVDCSCGLVACQATSAIPGVSSAAEPGWSQLGCRCKPGKARRQCESSNTLTGACSLSAALAAHAHSVSAAARPSCTSGAGYWSRGSAGCPATTAISSVYPAAELGWSQLGCRRKPGQAWRQCDRRMHSLELALCQQPLLHTVAASQLLPGPAARLALWIEA